MTFKQSLNLRPSRNLTICVAGQSLAEYLVTSSAGVSFIDRVKSRFSIESVDLVDGATGGSTAAKVNSLNTNFWYDTELSQNGSALTTALAEISAYTSKPTIIFWDQGQQDCRAASISSERVAAVTAYKAATLASWSALRSACNPTAPNSVPIFVMVLGRSSYSFNGGMDPIRQAQLDLIATTPNVFFAGEAYDLTLRDVVHPEPSSMKIYAERAADAIAKQVLSDAAINLGPTISSVVKTNENTITIAITPSGSGITKPQRPTGIRLENSAQPGVAVKWLASWSGNNLILTTETPITGNPVVFYPYDKAIPFDRLSVILDASTGRPLQSHRRL